MNDLERPDFVYENDTGIQETPGYDYTALFDKLKKVAAYTILAVSVWIIYYNAVEIIRYFM